MSAFIHNFFNIEIMAKSWKIILIGLSNTVQVSIVALVCAAVFGLALAVLRGLKNRLINALIIIYVDLFRALPTIVLFMLVYYM